MACWTPCKSQRFKNSSSLLAVVLRGGGYYCFKNSFTDIEPTDDP